MKRFVKIGVLVVIVVVALAVVGGGIVLSRLDMIVKRTVESEGTNQLDLTTALADADVSLFGGSLSLDKMTIANPAGYTAPNLFELGQVNVGVGYSGLTNDPVRIDSIDINSPRLVIERAASTDVNSLLKLNLRDLMENLDLSSEEETTKLIINRLTVTRCQVAVRPNIEGLEEEYQITLPDVTLNNIGTGDGAENGAEIGRVVGDLSMVLARRAVESEDLPPELRGLLAGDLQSIVNQYGDKLKAELREELAGQLESVREQFGDEAANLLDAASQGNVQEAVDGAVEEGQKRLEDEAKDRLKGLFGND